MNEQKGIIGQSMSWITHPLYSDEGISDWFAFLTLTLIAAFLWSTVIHAIE